MQCYLTLNVTLLAFPRVVKLHTVAMSVLIKNSLSFCLSWSSPHYLPAELRIVIFEV